MKKILFLVGNKEEYQQMKFLFSSFNDYQKVLITKYLLLQKDHYFYQKRKYSFIKTIWYIFKNKPEYIICMGNISTVPIVLFSKIFKSKIIYIEDYKSVFELSKAGKIIKKFANLFIVQSDILKEKYPDCIYEGWTI